MLYDDFLDENEKTVINRKIVFVRSDDFGNIKSSTKSDSVITVNKSGFVFIMDDYEAEQIDKFKVINGQLVLKDGKTIEEPQKTELQLEEEALQRQLEEIRQKRTEEES